VILDDLHARLHDHERRRGGKSDLDLHGDLRTGGRGKRRERESEHESDPFHELESMGAAAARKRTARAGRCEHGLLSSDDEGVIPTCTAWQ
jgi:hypothetical protein